MSPAERLKGMDLNLVVALDVLLEERGVSRAAKRLGVTQSAMSHTLKRLRESLEDPLLVNAKGGMVLTPRAEGLRLALRQGLLSLERALLPPETDPAHASWVFRVAAPDLIDLVLLPPLLARVRAASPATSLVFRGLMFGRQLHEALGSGELDLAVLPRMQLDQAGHLVGTTLLHDGYACFLRRDHPALDEGGHLSLDAYAEAPHLLVSPSGQGKSAIDHALARQGKQRQVVLRLPSFVTAPAVVAQSDLVLTAPSFMANVLHDGLGLHVCRPPVALDDHAVNMFWHPRMNDDPGHQWLRQHIVDVARSLERPAL